MNAAWPRLLGRILFAVAILTAAALVPAAWAWIVADADSWPDLLEWMVSEPGQRAALWYLATGVAAGTFLELGRSIRHSPRGPRTR